MIYTNFNELQYDEFRDALAAEYLDITNIHKEQFLWNLSIDYAINDDMRSIEFCYRDMLDLVN